MGRVIPPTAPAPAPCSRCGDPTDRHPVVDAVALGAMRVAFTTEPLCRPCELALDELRQTRRRAFLAQEET
jgi:hypothetical protein